MHAAIDILIREAEFEPKVAVAVSKAMTLVVEDAQFVTVPVLDSRFAAVDVKFAELRAEMNARFVKFKAEMDARFAKVDVRFAELRADMDVRFGRVDARFTTLKTDLIVWILVITVGNNYLPQIVSTVTSAIAKVVAAWR